MPIRTTVMKSLGFADEVDEQPRRDERDEEDPEIDIDARTRPVEQPLQAAMEADVWAGTAIGAPGRGGGEGAGPPPNSVAFR